MNCPVCLGDETAIFTNVDHKHYWRCHQCQARFLGAEYRITRDQEYAHYLHHENNVDDPQYRNFLQKIATPLLAKLKSAQNGLDYGCGPGPALAAMMEEAGHNMILYDPYFHKNEQALSLKYDFITCTETVEHFHHPAQEFQRLDAMLEPDGWLAIMTCFQDDDDKFDRWHYRRDPTHVVFYRQATFEWLAKHYGWSCEFPTKDVALMQKNR